MDALAIFMFVVWFWLAITVFADLFRRHDIPGWIKAIWVVALIVFPFIAVLAYLIFQARGMAERNVQQAQRARDELRRVVGFSVADEIQKLDGLKKAGSISDAETNHAPKLITRLLSLLHIALCHASSLKDQICEESKHDQCDYPDGRYPTRNVAATEDRQKR